MNVTKFVNAVRTETNSTHTYKGEKTLSDVIAIILILFGTASNVLVIFSLLKYTSKKVRADAATRLILNLAVSDLLFALIVLPMDRLQYLVTENYPLANQICRVQTTLLYWTFFVTLFSLTLVSINRLILIVYNPIYHKVYTKINMSLMISSAWILSLALALLPYFEIWGIYKLDFQQRTWCGIRRSDEKKPNSWPRDFFFILGFTLPGVTMVITYGLIWLKVIHQGNNFRANKSAERNFKLFKLIVIIFGAFMLCYFPNLFIRAILKQKGFGYAKAIGIILIWCNCCVNPIIYFSFNQQYRNALEKMLGFKLTCRRGEHPTPSSDHTSESALANQSHALQKSAQPLQRA